jgi:superfamily I DNA/RNA helicase
VLEKYRKKYKYLLVDEYQDTNFLQFRLLELLIGEEHNLCVVGDDDQSIYGWRGAKIENILNFPQKFNNAKHIKLEQNYRSTNIILKVSNSLISCNKTRHDKELWSNCGEGTNVRFVESDSGAQEAQFIADAITDIHLGKDTLPYKDMAVLYRSNYLSREIEDALRTSHIPYRLVGGKSFYERKEVRDAVAYLRLLVNPREDQSLLRIIGAPPRGIGDKAIERLKDIQSKTYFPLTELLDNNDFIVKLSAKAATGATELASCMKKYQSLFKESGGLAEKAQSYLRDVGYLDGLLKMYKNRDESEKRRDNVLELINAVGQYEMREGASASLPGFIESYCLADDNDKVDEEEEDSVTLMTIHASKGLEFPAIFIIGMEENIFPNERAFNEGALEEERRLFYVAITRAKHTLTMTRARERMRFGKVTRQMPSRFIAELPEDYVDKMHSTEAFKKVSADALQKAFENFTF